MEYTEAEQMDMVKKWWRQYGRYLLLAVMVGLLVGYGWRYYQQYKQRQAAAASIFYQQMTAQPLQGHAQKEDAMSVLAAHSLLKRFPKTAYANMASFWLAKNEILARRWSGALTYLQPVISGGKTPLIRQIARLRTARLLKFEKKYTAALAVLDEVSSSVYLPMIEETRGDIYVSQNYWLKAKASYAQAQAGFSKNDIEHVMLASKLARVLAHQSVAKKSDAAPSP